MADGDLFRRNVELSITKPTGGPAEPGEENTETITMTDLDMQFAIERTITKEPSTLEVKVYNLSEDTRSKLQKSKNVDVVFKVSYGNDDLYTIFKGDMRDAIHTREGPTLVTTITAGDGERSQAQWISKTYGKDTSYKTVIKELLERLGVGEGNIADLDNLSDDTGQGLSSTFKTGIAIHGHAAEELGELLSSKGIEYSIQGNELQILSVGKAVARGTAIPLLTPETGLIGVPTVSNKKIMSCECLIQPAIYPGALIEIQSEFVEGKYKVRRANYDGDTRAGDFVIRIEGRPER